MRKLSLDPSSSSSRFDEVKRNWRQIVATYQHSDLKRSVWQMANSVVPYLALWYLAYRLLAVSYWLALPVALLAAGFMVRVFIIFHDCGHGSFFRSRCRQRRDGLHHGHPDAHALRRLAGRARQAPRHRRRPRPARVRRRVDDDRQEYQQASFWRRSATGSTATRSSSSASRRSTCSSSSSAFTRRGAETARRVSVHVDQPGARRDLRGALRHRRRQGDAARRAAAPRDRRRGRHLAVLRPAPVRGASTGSGAASATTSPAAMEGSSLYALPRVLQWFSGNIGFHHIHHLAPRDPQLPAPEGVPRAAAAPARGPAHTAGRACARFACASTTRTPAAWSAFREA